jgi:hypothetical protein
MPYDGPPVHDYFKHAGGHDIFLLLNIHLEITAFEFKLTANKSYRSTVGDRLGAGVKVDRG